MTTIHMHNLFVFITVLVYHHYRSLCCTLIMCFIHILFSTYLCSIFRFFNYQPPCSSEVLLSRTAWWKAEEIRVVTAVTQIRSPLQEFDFTLGLLCGGSAIRLAHTSHLLSSTRVRQAEKIETRADGARGIHRDYSNARGLSIRDKTPTHTHTLCREVLWMQLVVSLKAGKTIWDILLAIWKARGAAMKEGGEFLNRDYGDCRD